MYVWNTQGNLYVSGRLAANENHTLWFLMFIKSTGGSQCSQKFSKIIATRFSKTSQEVTLAITKRDRNHDGS